MTYKHYAAGDILSAADANYLMRQGLIVVANDVERDQINVPTEGMRVYRLDTHGIESYTGTAWNPHDTGWLAIPVNTGYQAQDSLPPQMRRVGDFVHTRGGWSNVGIGSSSSNLLGTVPVGFRPSGEVHTVPATSTPAAQAAGARLLFRPTGPIELRTGATVGSYYFMTNAPWAIN